MVIAFIAVLTGEAKRSWYFQHGNSQVFWGDGMAEKNHEWSGLEVVG